MSKPTFTVRRKGEDITFESAFDTLAEAYRALDAQVRKSDFALDLMAAARARRLSTVQAAWIHKLATDAQKPADERHIVEGLDLFGVIALFDHAHAAGKQFPKIVLAEAFDDDRHEVLVKINRLGSRSQNEGCANIKNANDEWAGTILRDGRVKRGFARAFSDVEDVLRQLAKDPTAVLAQNGIAVGQCCYCARALTDKRSREVGYGPICAEKFGLPWGSHEGADAASKEATIVKDRGTNA